MKRHFYHLIDKSHWPLLASFAGFNLLVSLELLLQKVNNVYYYFLLAIVLVLLVMYGWWRDVVREASYLSEHTLVVQRGLKMGFILFLVSEIMIFFALFWGFLHFSLAPSVELGMVWPPVNVIAFKAYELPLVNTLILLWSGFTVTAAHISIRLNKYDLTLWYLGFTIVLGFLFILLQGVEYVNAPFNITDSVYGSIFFGLTGLHGFHVIIGVLFLTVCFIRMYWGQFNRNQTLGFDFAVWYWHMVDVVWLLVFIMVYVWGNWIS